MLKLTERYGARPAPELPLLFQRILQNTIRDFYRRQKVRSMWTTPLSSLFGTDAGEEADPLETLDAVDDSQFSESPGRAIGERSSCLHSLRKRWKLCRHVNGRRFCCVIGRNWTLRKPPRSWVARREA